MTVHAERRVRERARVRAAFAEVSQIESEIGDRAQYGLPRLPGLDAALAVARFRLALVEAYPGGW